MTLCKLAEIPKQRLWLVGDERGELRIMAAKAEQDGLWSWQEPVCVAPTVTVYRQLSTNFSHNAEDIILRKYAAENTYVRCGFGPLTKTWIIREQPI